VAGGRASYEHGDENSPFIKRNFFLLFEKILASQEILYCMELVNVGNTCYHLIRNLSLSYKRNTINTSKNLF